MPKCFGIKSSNLRQQICVTRFPFLRAFRIASFKQNFTIAPILPCLWNTFSMTEKYLLKYCLHNFLGSLKYYLWYGLKKYILGFFDIPVSQAWWDPLPTGKISQKIVPGGKIAWNFIPIGKLNWTWSPLERKLKISQKSQIDFMSCKLWNLKSQPIKNWRDFLSSIGI